MTQSTRRRFIKTTLASGASLALPAFGQAPAVITAESTRPQVPSGLRYLSARNLPEMFQFANDMLPVEAEEVREGFVRRGNDGH